MIIPNGMEEYKDRYTITSIDGRDNSVQFANGIKIYAGDVIGEVNENQLRRIQIRETILSHIERERKLFYKGIKVLSLFLLMRLLITESMTRAATRKKADLPKYLKKNITILLIIFSRSLAKKNI